MSVTQTSFSGVIANVVEVDDSVACNNVAELCGDDFRGGSLNVLGFLEESEIVCWVV